MASFARVNFRFLLVVILCACIVSPGSDRVSVSITALASARTLSTFATATIVISEFRTRGLNGGNDEFIELYNPGSAPVNISGWKINRANNSFQTFPLLTINANTTIPPHCHFLAVNNGSDSYSGSVAGDQTYTANNPLLDNGGIALVDLADNMIDQVGMSATSTYKEGTPLSPLATPENRGYERKPGGANGSTQDTDDNSADFVVTSPSDPQNLASTPVPATNLHITGTVADSGGRRVTNVRITVSGGNLASPVVVTTGRGGQFSFSGLFANQTYTVTVAHPRFAFSPASRNINLALIDAIADFTASP